MKYIISDISQLRYIPKNSFGVEIVLETIRNIRNYNNSVFKIIHLKLYNNYLCSLLYEVSTPDITSNLYVYNIEEILNILNNNGFDIEYQQRIILNTNETTILNSVYNLGYNYIQCGRYNETNSPLNIYISTNPTNSYSSNQEFILLKDLCTFTDDDFVWLKEKPYNSLSIPLLLDKQYPEPLS